MNLYPIPTVENCRTLGIENGRIHPAGNCIFQDAGIRCQCFGPTKQLSNGLAD